MEDSKKRHYAVIEAYPRKLTLKRNNEIIVESRNALILKEVAKSVYNPVFYFPKEDIKADLVSETERKSYCPIKGDASYWNFKENPTSDYLAWSYEKALVRAKKIEGYIAFNLDQITIISEPI
jgi:uncharacterized protein (DUF427 family)